jgi:hypothetical protein
MMAEITGGTGIDTREFRAVAQALKKAQPLLRRELVANLRVAGELVAKDARSIISEHSTSIPPTIKTRVRGVGVSVEAGGIVGRAALAKSIFTAGYGTVSSESALRRMERTATEGTPLAGLLELGNKGKKSASQTAGGTFRHPVFGSSTFVNQEMHPYLAAAGKKDQAQVDAAIYKALDAVTEEIVHGR